MNSAILIIGILVTAFALIISCVHGRRSASAVILGAGLLLFIVDAVLGWMTIHAGSIELARRYECVRLVATIPTTIVWLWFSFSSFAGATSEKGRKFWLLLTVAGLVLAVIGGFLSPVFIIDNVVAQERDLLFRLSKFALVLPVAALVGATSVLMNLERALRGSSGINRWKMKFMLLGIGVLFVVRIYTNTQAIVYGTIYSALDIYINGSLIVGSALILVSLFRSKSSIATIYPSQEIIYKSFTLLLVGLYVLIVGVLAEVVTVFGGVAAFPLKAFCLLLATVGLAALFLSERVRYRSRQWISRHFKRPMYDFRRVWTTVSARTASALDEFELCRVATRIISETLQVLSASIWLVPASRSDLVLGASTSLSASAAAQFTGAEGKLAEALEQLGKSEGPINIDQSKEKWVEPLKRCNPDQFREAGDRICVPIRAGDELLGFIMVGDRVTGVSLSVEDCDLLKCISDQLGRDILNGRLSRRVAEAKEFQAFQTMATFFVHDLKNTAWTLSLMLQNLRSHFDDPKFREDALKAVGQSVARMNELISRLTALREGLQLNCAATDLNNLVEAAVKEFTESAAIAIRQEYRPLPQLKLDAEQIKKVVANLVLNAGDALRVQGEIQIETTRSDGWAILSVRDNGCGMTAEFMQRQLFRPFQTTKKKGIGIGMFQSKMIVEAHQGKIEVESAEGKGSTFRVFLPIPAQAGE